MDNELLIKKLRAAHKALGLALEALAEGGVQGEQVGECPMCGQPIYASEKLRRGIHNKCYQRAAVRVKNGEITWEELEKAGLVEPPSKGGRPRQPLPIEIDPEVEADTMAKLTAAAKDYRSKNPVKKKKD